MSTTATDIGTARRWSMLALGMFAQAAQAVFVNGVAFLIPELQATHGLDLARSGLIVAAPTLGVVVTLVAWGAAADRFGERRVLTLGMAACTATGVGAALAPSLVLVWCLLFVGGMAAASANAASGRVVVGWFPPHRRGLAMGMRQMSLPLGIAVAALTMPGIGHEYGLGAAFAVPTVLCALAALACGCGVLDPPRPDRAAAAESGLLANPYRSATSPSRTAASLWRIHAASALLVVPQYTVWTFALVWLIADEGWSATSAGLVVTVAQILGAAGRMGVGYWSDRVGSRMTPLRTVAITGAGCMTVLALADGWGTGTAGTAVAVAALVAASVVTVAPNGLAFTAVAEIAGPYWGGRALGIQNTGQFVVAATVPPVIGAVIAVVGYPAAFAVSALFPALAAPLVPSDGASRTGADETPPPSP